MTERIIYLVLALLGSIIVLAVFITAVWSYWTLFRMQRGIGRISDADEDKE